MATTLARSGVKNETTEGTVNVIETASAGDIPAGSAIVRAIRILEVLADHDRPPQLAEVSRAVGLPKPTVLRILATLEHAGMVAREPDSKRYGFAERLNRFAGQVVMSSPGRAERRAILEELVEQVGETCNLTVPSGSAVVYLERVESAWPLRLQLGPGSRFPLYASGSGKLFLAFMAKRSRDRFIARTPLIAHTATTLSTPERLAAEFEAIRAQGYSVDNQEYLLGIGCVAVPVRSPRGRVVAAVSVQVPFERLSLEDALTYLPSLREAAAAVSKTIDW